MKEGINPEEYKMLEFEGGYAVIKENELWIPAREGAGLQLLYAQEIFQLLQYCKKCCDFNYADCPNKIER